MKSALLLERYFFTRIEVRPNTDAKPEGTYSVTTAGNVARAEDDPSRYQVTLIVTVGPDTASPAMAYYSGVVEVVGFFRIAEGYPDDPGKLVTISGSSLLYGAVREMFSNLTARGPWPMISLPTMNFTPQAPAPARPANPTIAAGPVRASAP
jgi:preprotein translocase subunit SecB